MRTRVRALCAVLLLLLGAPAATTEPAAETVPPPPGERMQALAFLLGEWTGGAWVQMGAGPRQEIEQRERVAWEVGGEVLLIRGEGWASDPGGGERRRVHDALAVVAWDPDRAAYAMWSYAAGRGAGLRDLEVGERSFVWRQQAPGGEARYSMHLDEEGRWVETGEFSRDGGETWLPFFGMTLTRVE